MKRTDFSGKIADSIVLFQEGLESNHIEVAMLKFWTVIELLCSKTEKETTDKVIDRATSIFLHPSLTKMRLQFIQEYRDRLVHRGQSGGHALLCAQWGSIYAAGLIRFCLLNRYKLKKHAEILEYLSIKPDANHLKAKLRLYRYRLRSIRAKESGSTKSE
jgi:hypothetical protein